MNGNEQPSQASFPCQYCSKPIFIPAGLPATTAPCPHCAKQVTSPDFSKPAAAAPLSPAPTPASAPAASSPAAAQPKSAVEPSNKPLETAPTTSATDKKTSVMPMVCAAVVVLLIAAGVVYWAATKADNSQQTTQPSTKTPTTGGTEAHGTWKHEVSQVLEGFMKAKTPDEKMAFVIPNPGVLDELKKYCPEGSDESDTPLSSFSFAQSHEEDSKRGIYLMRYRQPSQVDIREFFGPIGTLDAVMKKADTTYIEMAYRMNEDALADPVGINAFFKLIDGSYKLDASVYIQGKHRTFKHFTEYPQPGEKRVFRVLINESISHHYRNDSSVRSYRIADFAYPNDVTTVQVKVNSQLGKQLALLNWRGLDKPAQPKTATVELEWNNSSPSQLGLSRLVCWEFLGVGGQEGNAKVKAPQE
ncbi:MAG: hypothetical protein ACPG32_03700 [Akkermansiaceae bacterium]